MVGVGVRSGLRSESVRGVARRVLGQYQGRIRLAMERAHTGCRDHLPGLLISGRHSTL